MMFHLWIQRDRVRAGCGPGTIPPWLIDPRSLRCVLGRSGVLLTTLLLVLVIALVVAFRGRIFTRRWGLLVGLTLGAAAWTFFTVGAPVMVPDPEDPQGIECVITAEESVEPGWVMTWDDDCGHALRNHLVVSIGPSVVMAGAVLAVLPIALVRRSRLDMSERPIQAHPAGAMGHTP